MRVKWLPVGIAYILGFSILIIGCGQNQNVSTVATPKNVTDWEAEDFSDSEVPNTSAAPLPEQVTDNSDIEKIRFDGLYQCIQDDTTEYLRFFSDGKVVTASVLGSPTLEQAEHVIQWLDHDWEVSGSYKIENDMIEFDITSSRGSVSYDGKIISDEMLEFDIVSHINDYTATKQYTFCEVAAQ